MSTQLDLDIFSGKTSSEYLTPKTTHSETSLLDWLAQMMPLCPKQADGVTRVLCLDKKDRLHGECLTPSISEWHREGAEYSYAPVTLREVLETGDVDRHYFLSAKACAGILKRAKKRGKALPVQLMAALEHTAWPPSENM